MGLNYAQLSYPKRPTCLSLPPPLPNRLSPQKLHLKKTRSAQIPAEQPEELFDILDEVSLFFFWVGNQGTNVFKSFKVFSRKLA